MSSVGCRHPPNYGPCAADGLVRVRPASDDSMAGDTTVEQICPLLLGARLDLRRDLALTDRRFLCADAESRVALAPGFKCHDFHGL